MSKPIIAVDIDDVLSASAEGFVNFSNQQWGTNLKVSDYLEGWAEMWQVDLVEVTRRSAVFHDSGIVAEYKHHDEALPVLKMLSSTYDLVAITSRQRSIEKPTREWMDKHYKGIFKDIQFAGIFDEPLHAGMLQKTKADLFVSNNVEYVIDDQLKHCKAAAELGIQSILFGDYSWNQLSILPVNMVRCKNWQEVAEFFDARR